MKHRHTFAALSSSLALVGMSACSSTSATYEEGNLAPTASGAPAAASVEPSEAAPAAEPMTCPVTGAVLETEDADPGDYHAQMGDGFQSNEDWWPNQLRLEILHANSELSNPLDEGFDYAAAFSALDLDAVKADIEEVMTTSQDWWPADWGHYGPLFIRMAWHSAGTYRVGDGRGGAADGTLRFAPLNSWPDNANLDKARRLLWPVKQKYGQSISWADLMVLAGNCALESAGFETFGFGGGREDVWEPQNDVYWGSEGTWLSDAERYSGERELENPLAAVQMGLIYVNPEGPGGNPDPLLAAADIRETFGRMAMNDEETVALIAGGHTLGKVHGAASPEGTVGPEPEAAGVENQGFGWLSSHGTGKGADTITSGLEGAWTQTPTDWSSMYLDNLWEYEWELGASPAGAKQWFPVGIEPNVPDAHVEGKMNLPIMLTTDLALRFDPVYGEISRRWYENPTEFDEAFAKAWYKLTHRDMGPASRLLGPEVAPPQLWQDPVPAVDHPLVTAAQVADLKQRVLDSGLTVPQLVRTAWASAASFRDGDKRGGANGARIRLEPQRSWEVNDPRELATVLAVLERVKADFDGAQADGTRISMADLIVLAGGAAVEQAAREAGVDVEVPFVPGRTDATDEMTDAASFAALELTADGFRNYYREGFGWNPAEMLVDKADQLTLTAPEMTVLVGGMRAMGANHGGSTHGVLTGTTGTLTNEWFVNLLDVGTAWEHQGGDVYVGRDRATGEERYTATSVDLVFGSNSQLRSLAEVYASADGGHKFVHDFVEAWDKVMMLDRYDVK